MEEKIVIYVSGNPEAYPIEYYDGDSETFQGLLPKLYREFSDQSRFEIEYYQPGKEDNREHLAENLQVDILSGCIQEEEAFPDTLPLTVIKTDQSGNEITYGICFTEAAPEDFISELSAFINTVPQEKICGQLIASAEPERDIAGFYWGIAALSLTVVILLTVIALLTKKFTKKLQKVMHDLEVDEVTGLGNFDYLKRYYKQYINDKHRILYNLFYFNVDTDHLRRLSSSDETNEFLRYCALTLQEYTADTDILAKVSDGGFVLYKLTSNLQNIDEWLRPILIRVREYSREYSKSYEVDMSVGIYPLKAESKNMDEMIFSAGQAANIAAQEHEDYVICSDQMLQRLEEEKQIQASIEEAFERNEFRLYIQFYVNANTFGTVGGEALSRWNHPQKGLLAPNYFVPLLEREKLISRLDFYCLKNVCDFLEDLYNNGVENFFISCNFSRLTFGSADFAEKCKKLMDDYHFTKDLLIFELTESVYTKNVSIIQNNINELKNYGIKIALDDFGEGFTSFFDLQKYPVDGIKLDKTLVDNISNSSGYSILKAMIAVGHELGVTILAEGVETDEQVQTLQKLHCDVIQGFRFSFPLPDWEAKSKVLKRFL